MRSRPCLPCAPWAWVLWLVLLATAPATAHQASDAYLRLAPADARSVTLQVDVALRDLDLALDLDADGDGRLRWGEVRTREEELTRYVADGLQLDAGRCRLTPAGPLALDRKADGVYAVLRFSAPCPASGTLLGYRLMEGLDPTHRGLLVQAQRPGAVRSLAPGAPPLVLGTGGEAEKAGGRWGLFTDGLHHILVGLDHVLFLVCLVLPAALARDNPAQGWRARAMLLLALVTAFTLAHSITLGLAALRVLSVPSHVAEVLIAVTVVLTAWDNLRPFLGQRRVATAFVFGLVHGFGFAGPLLALDLPPADLAWALLQFNLGVEAGQLVVVVLALALLGLVQARRPAVGPRLLHGGSLAVGLLALVWLGERLFAVKLLPA